MVLIFLKPRSNTEGLRNAPPHDDTHYLLRSAPVRASHLCCSQGPAKKLLHRQPAGGRMGGGPWVLPGAQHYHQPPTSRCQQYHPPRLPQWKENVSRHCQMSPGGGGGKLALSCFKNHCPTEITKRCSHLEQGTAGQASNNKGLLKNQATSLPRRGAARASTATWRAQ